ncbi:hypothetical protein Patl1_20263 [Pistacia atlantica]|uniref:Uncharacterized protein n=1 Tax=Pistacia atlantica TaxID=434234 RepID=A0ACC1BN80_9ROSI|nr:hypothetical protein Patl1_20263 [Pistacia atlantica]
MFPHSLVFTISQLLAWVLKPPRMPFSLHRSLRVTASPPTSLNHEEFAEPEFDHSTVLRNDTVSSLQKYLSGHFSGYGYACTILALDLGQYHGREMGKDHSAGSWVIPLIAHTAGFGKKSLTYRGQALYRLLTDMAEGLIGIAILLPFSLNVSSPSI